MKNFQNIKKLTLNKMGLSKRLFEEIEQFAELAHEGEANEIETYIHLKELGEFVEAKMDYIKESLIRKVSNENGKLIMLDYEVAVSQKTTWDFKGMKAWVEKKAELSEIETKAKLAAQLNLKIGNNTKEGFDSGIADSNTGEVLEAAIATYSKPFLTIKKLKDQK
jgi:hypothetical protein